MSDPTLPPDLEAEGFLSYPIVGLARLVAETAKFQAQTGAADTDGAYAFIHYPHLKGVADICEVKRPAAVIQLGKTLNFRRRGNNQLLRPEGDLLLTLTDWDKFPDRSDYSEIAFLNFIGPLLWQIAELQGEDDRLAIEGMSWEQIPGVTNPTLAQQHEPYWICEVRVDWSRL